MPFPPISPFSNEAGAIMQPRQLQRWLDVNPIHALTRIQSYIELPVFSIVSEWKGYSEIVGVFNYTSTKNFSLKSFSEILDPNYVACIMWVDDEYNVYRYKLWENVGELFYFPIELYNDQLIKSNFRIEIWNVAPTGPLLEFNLVGAGRTIVNQTYEYVSSTFYAGPTYSIEFYGGTWNVLDSSVSPSLVYYTLTPTSTNPFPFGLWVIGAGDGPPPIASVNTICSQSSALIFYTSALGNYDYRYANDFLLAVTPPVVTGMSVNLPANLPINWPVGSYPTLN